MDIAKAFGDRVRELRTKRGLTQQQLGDQAKVNYKYLGSIERGRENPSLAVVARLAHALAVTPTELLDIAHLAHDPEGLRQRIAAELSDAKPDQLRRMLRILTALRE